MRHVYKNSDSMTVLAESNPLGYTPSAMQTVAETLIFTRQTEKLFGEDEKRMVATIAAALETMWKQAR